MSVQTDSVDTLKTSAATDGSVPAWVGKHLDASGLKRISEAIGSAESKCSGEIVPMLARRSSGIGHAGILAFAVLALVFSSLVPVVQSGLLAAGTPDVALATLNLGALALALLGALLVYRSNAALRFCIAPHDRVVNCQRRALLEFQISRIAETSAHTGVLLYVSLLERQAVVIADRAIAEKLPPQAWQDVVEVLLKGIRGGDFSKGFADAIALAGAHLREHFPVESHGQDEIPNQLLFRDA